MAQLLISFHTTRDVGHASHLPVIHCTDQPFQGPTLLSALCLIASCHCIHQVYSLEGWPVRNRDMSSHQHSNPVKCSTITGCLRNPRLIIKAFTAGGGSSRPGSCRPSHPGRGPGRQHGSACCSRNPFFPNLVPDVPQLDVSLPQGQDSWRYSAKKDDTCQSCSAAAPGAEHASQALVRWARRCAAHPVPHWVANKGARRVSSANPLSRGSNTLTLLWALCWESQMLVWDQCLQCQGACGTDHSSKDSSSAYEWHPLTGNFQLLLLLQAAMCLLCADAQTAS